MRHALGTKSATEESEPTYTLYQNAERKPELTAHKFELWGSANAMM